MAIPDDSADEVADQIISSVKEPRGGSRSSAFLTSAFGRFEPFVAGFLSSFERLLLTITAVQILVSKNSCRASGMPAGAGDQVIRWRDAAVDPKPTFSTRHFLIRSYLSNRGNNLESGEKYFLAEHIS